MEATVTGFGFDLVDTERSAGGLLRITIDRVPGTVYDTPGEAITVEDCERVTRQLQYVLEVEGCDYARLEVSSPGLDRPLKKPADWERFAGLEVQLTLRLPFQGRKHWKGLLVQREGGWRLELPPPEAAKKGNNKAGKVAKAAKPGKPGSASKAAQGAKATAQTQDDKAAAAQQALDFTLDEVREARLVPVLDFKGRKNSAATGHDGLEAAAAQDDGGTIQ